MNPPSFSVDKQTLALISIVGSALDVLGALYLAYDLLGGEHGPLRTLTRSVTYGLLFGIGYGVALGPVFGLIAGIAHGLTLGWEFSRASRNEPKAGFWFDAAMSAIRGLSYGLGSAYYFGPAFGATFGGLITVGQTIAYRFGIRPDAEYKQDTHPHITRFQILTALNRTVGYGIAGYLSSLVAADHNHAFAFGIKAGLATGLVSAIAGACRPFIEWFAEHLPERRLGVFGIALILCGFTLGSLQYWATLLDVKVLDVKVTGS